MIVARPYQAQALEDIRSAWVEIHAEGKAPRILLVSRTGTGKTVIAGEFLRMVLGKGRRAAFVVRDRTLLNQTSRHLDAIGLTDHGVVAAGHPRKRPRAPLQICSAQTLSVRGEAPEADVLVFDEAHGILCATSLQIVQSYPEATILGLTASPERGDGQPMGDVFHRLIQVKATYADLVAIGALVPCRVIAPGGQVSGGLAQDPIDVLKQYAPLGRGHKPVIFGTTRAHATALAEQARAAGYRAAEVHGATKERDLRDRLDRFMLPGSDPRALDVLTNCDLLTQGWDAPPADVGIIARGCTVWSAWIQICGRFLRPSPATGKRIATIVDLRGSVYVHMPPSADRSFSLEVSETQRDKKDRLPLASCKRCGAVYLYGPPRCPSCGEVTPPQPLPKIKKRKLAEVLHVADRDAKRATFERLCAEQRARGHKVQWVAFKFRGIYGHFPPWKMAKPEEKSA